jgi:hypothetical protein
MFRLVIRLLRTSLKSIALIVIQKFVSQITLSRLLVLADSTILLKILVIKTFAKLACR